MYATTPVSSFCKISIVSETLRIAFILSNLAKSWKDLTPLLLALVLAWSPSATSRLPSTAEPPPRTITPRSIRWVSRTRAPWRLRPNRRLLPQAPRTPSGRTLTSLVLQFFYVCFMLHNFLSLQLTHMSFKAIGRRDGQVQSLTVFFFFRLPGSSTRRAAEPRLVRLKRIHVELGVQICGGNLYGIFVESLDDDSPAKSPDGLLPGDLILEVPAAFSNHLD